MIFCLKNIASDWNITNCIGYKRLCGDWGVLAKHWYQMFLIQGVPLILNPIKVFENDGSAGGQIVSQSEISNIFWNWKLHVGLTFRLLLLLIIKKMS